MIGENFFFERGFYTSVWRIINSTREVNRFHLCRT